MQFEWNFENKPPMNASTSIIRFANCLGIKRIIE